MNLSEEEKEPIEFIVKLFLEKDPNCANKTLFWKMYSQDLSQHEIYEMKARFENWVFNAPIKNDYFKEMKVGKKYTLEELGIKL